MIGIFSTKGRIGRVSFVLRYIFLTTLIISLGPILWILIELLKEPFPPAWGEDSAAFVKKYLGWVVQGSGPIYLASLFAALGIRSALCTCVKRARDIGVEISSVWEGLPYFMGVTPGANMWDLTYRKSVD